MKNLLTIEVEETTGEKLRTEWVTYVKAMGKFIPFSIFLGERMDRLYASDRDTSKVEAQKA